MGKNYELKVTQGLSFKQRIVVKGKRIALLVPKLLNSLKNGFKKFLKGVGLVVASPVIAGAAALNAINQGLNVVTDKMAGYASGEIDAHNERVFDKAEDKIETKNQQLYELEQQSVDYANQALVDMYKNAYLKDIKALERKQLKTVNPPRKILIAAMFVKKLTKNTVGAVNKARIAAGHGIVAGATAVGHSIQTGVNTVSHRIQAGANFVGQTVQSGIDAVGYGLNVAKATFAVAPEIGSYYKDLIAKRVEADRAAKEFALQAGIDPETALALEGEVLEQDLGEKKNLM